MPLHAPVRSVFARFAASLRGCTVVSQPSHSRGLGRLFLLMITCTSQPPLDQTLMLQGSNRPVRPESGPGSGKGPGDSGGQPDVSLATFLCRQLGRPVIPGEGDLRGLVGICNTSIQLRHTCRLGQGLWKIGRDSQPQAGAKSTGSVGGWRTWQANMIMFATPPDIGCTGLLVNTHRASPEGGCEAVGGDQVFPGVEDT